MKTSLFNINLHNFAKFEEQHSTIYAGNYQFWGSKFK